MMNDEKNRKRGREEKSKEGQRPRPINGRTRGFAPTEIRENSCNSWATICGNQCNRPYVDECFSSRVFAFLAAT